MCPPASSVQPDAVIDQQLRQRLAHIGSINSGSASVDAWHSKMTRATAIGTANRARWQLMYCKALQAGRQAGTTEKACCSGPRLTTFMSHTDSSAGCLESWSSTDRGCLITRIWLRANCQATQLVGLQEARTRTPFGGTASCKCPSHCMSCGHAASPAV